MQMAILDYQLLLGAPSPAIARQRDEVYSASKVLIEQNILLQEEIAKHQLHQIEREMLTVVELFIDTPDEHKGETVGFTQRHLKDYVLQHQTLRREYNLEETQYKYGADSVVYQKIMGHSSKITSAMSIEGVQQDAMQGDFDINKMHKLLPPEALMELAMIKIEQSSKEPQEVGKKGFVDVIKGIISSIIYTLSGDKAEMKEFVDDCRKCFEKPLVVGKHTARWLAEQQARTGTEQNIQR